MSAARRIDWKQVATALAARIPRERLHPAVLAWSDDPVALRRKWGVALSGGADSVALLLLLWAHWPKRRRALLALHFDHQLRGAAVARRDREFCRGLCSALGVTLVVGRWHRSDLRRRATDLPAPANEAQARASRMEFLHHHARVLWLGHQQDDVAETILMRVARGSGTTGLAAPRPVHEVAGGRVHLRPLLGLKKVEIAAALKASGGTWREDASNATDAYFRNRVRRSVLPAWQEAAGRDAVAGAARSRELLEEDDAALEAWLDHLRPVTAKGELRLQAIRGKPRALVRRAVHRWLLSQPSAFHLSRQAVDALVGAVEIGDNTRHSLGPKQFAVIRRGVLSLKKGNDRPKFQRSVN
ncbi:MAG TPA: tRNA lysidine(34) synthetase TilS [Opitutaceae bacterium]|nr:tRNA lysidine(34) synthetase TilS [Opitutaceae bacterium]